MISIDDRRLEFRQRGLVVIDTGIDDAVLDGVLAALPSIDGRVQDHWRHAESVHAVATAPGVLDALETLYGRTPRPFQTLNFQWGTEQPAHADTIHFSTEPFGLMCGVWVALEDIGPDQGPLVYYPGSQDLPEMNLDHFGLPPNYERHGDYEEAIRRLITERRYEPEYGIIERGQAVVWSANILHGGSPRLDPTRTRWSQVTHYYFEGAITWRPALSDGERHYFEPDWIPDRWPGHEPTSHEFDQDPVESGWGGRLSRRARSLLRRGAA